MPQNSYEQEALERIQQMYSPANRSGSSPYGSQNNARRNSQVNFRRGQSHTEHSPNEPSQNKSFNNEPFQNRGGRQGFSEKGAAQDESPQKEPLQKEPSQKEPSQKEPLQKEPLQKEPSQKGSWNNDTVQNAYSQNLPTNNVHLNSGTDILDSFFKDKEKTLIMLLIAILSNDGADSSIILALMYLII